MKNNEYGDYIQDIYNSIKETEEFTGNMTFEEFCRDRKTTNAVIRSIEVIGEASKNIPKSIKDKYSDIPWKKMAGMRDKLMHEYSGVDLEIVWQVVRHDLPLVKPLIAKILNDINKRGLDNEKD